MNCSQSVFHGPAKPRQQNHCGDHHADDEEAVAVGHHEGFAADRGRQRGERALARRHGVRAQADKVTRETIEAFLKTNKAVLV